VEDVRSASRPRVRVQIDLNSRDADGYVRARLSHVAGGDLQVADLVTVFEPDDRVTAIAKVSRIEPSRGFVYLDVDWDTLDEYEIVELPLQNPAEGSRPTEVTVSIYGVRPSVRRRSRRGRRVERFVHSGKSELRRYLSRSGMRQLATPKAGDTRTTVVMPAHLEKVVNL
jgi:hypothetical protein